MKKKKISKHNCSKCGSKLEVVFEGDGIQYPVFSCPEHGVQNNEWEKWWNIYSSRWKEKEYWNKPADKPSCILGYFCNKYAEFFGYSYSLQISSPIPYSSKDFVMIRRLLSMFDSDAKEVMIYIKWMFAKKIRKNYPITSLGFFTSANLINEYKHAKLNSMILKRYSLLPNCFINWCKETHQEIFEKHELKDWNDLNSLVSYIKTYGDDNIEGKIVNEAVSRGLLENKDTFKKLEG